MHVASLNLYVYIRKVFESGLCWLTLWKKIWPFQRFKYSYIPMGLLYLWFYLWESWELLYMHENLCVWTVEIFIVSLCFVNMYVVNFIMLIICTCMSVSLYGRLIVRCMLYQLGRVDFVSKDERDMWRIISWECGILVVNRQVVVHSFVWFESYLFEEACFVDLCLVNHWLNTKMV